jgi:hypothetical protein
VHPDRHDRRDGSAIILHVYLDGRPIAVNIISDDIDPASISGHIESVIDGDDVAHVYFFTCPPDGDPPSGARRDADRPDSAAAEPERTGLATFDDGADFYTAPY